MGEIDRLTQAKAEEQRLSKEGLIATARVDAQTMILWRTDRWASAEEAVRAFRAQRERLKPTANVLERKPMRNRRQ